MKKIVAILEGLFTKDLFLERLTIICVLWRMLTGNQENKKSVKCVAMEFNLTVNLKVVISIWLYKYHLLYIRVSDTEYDLYMRVDSNTQGHRQWFYFSIKNEKPCTLKLNIYRFKKVYSLFQRGMRPYYRSRK